MTPLVLLALTIAPDQGPAIKWETKSFVLAGKYDIQGTYPRFEGNSLAALASKDLKAETIKRLTAFKHDAEANSSPEDGKFSVTLHSTAYLAQSRLISVLATAEYYTGGAHGNLDYATFNYANTHGKPKKIQLQDILIGGGNPEDVASRWIIPKLKKLHASSVENGSITKLTREQASQFVIAKKGLTWMFAPDEMASHAEGAFTVLIPWSGLRGKISALIP